MRREGNKILIVEPDDIPAPSGIRLDVEGGGLVQRIGELRDAAITAIVQSDKWHYVNIRQGYGVSAQPIPKQDGSYEICCDEDYVSTADFRIIPRESNVWLDEVKTDMENAEQRAMEQSVTKRDQAIERLSVDSRIAFRDTIRSIMRGEQPFDAMAVDVIREITEWHDEGRPDVQQTKRRVLTNYDQNQGGQRWLMFAVREFVSTTDLPIGTHPWETFPADEHGLTIIAHRAITADEHQTWGIDRHVTGVSLEFRSNGIIIAKQYRASDYLQFLVQAPLDNAAVEAIREEQMDNIIQANLEDYYVQADATGDSYENLPF